MARDKDLVKDALEAFAQFADEENEQRSLMLDDYEFRALKQWDENLRALRENDPHGARPCLVFDRTNQHVRQVVNDGRLNRPGMKVRPVDSEADPRTAEMINGVIRHIESVSKADMAYDWALECAATAGIGWFRILSHVVDREGNQEPRIARIANPLSVYVGTAWTEPDGCDLMELFITADMGRKEFKRKYKDADPCSVQDALGDEIEWVSRDTIRVAEWFKIEEGKENRLLIRGGDDKGIGEKEYWDTYAGDMNRPEVSGSYEKRNRIVRWRKISAKEVLDETIFPASYIPVIPVIGNEIWVGNKRILMGMVRPAMDPQRMYNMARSNFAEHVTMSPRAKWLMADGQEEGHEREWRDAHRSSNPVLHYRPTIDGQPAQPPQRIFGPEIPQGLSADLALSERDLQAAMGQYGPSLGAPSNERSGVAIREKKSEGDRGNFHYVDNLGRSIRHACTIIVGNDDELGMLRLYDVPRVIRILGEDAKPKSAELNPEQPRAYEAYEQEDGSVREVFNPHVGHYDVIPSSGPAYPTLRAEAAAAMIQIVQANPAILQTHGDLIFESQDWPDAERFAKRFKAMLPPQLQDADENGPLDPQAVEAVMQREQQIQMMGAQMQEMAKAMQALQQKANSNDAAVLKEQVEAARLQLENQKLQLEAFNAETDRMKAVAEIDLRAAQADKADSEANKVDAETHSIRTGTAKKNEDGTWSLSMGDGNSGGPH